MYNKSRTYILPLICARLDISHQYCGNTYLYTYDDFDKYQLYVEHVFGEDVDIEEYNNKLSKTKTLDVVVLDEHKRKYLYCFKLDNDFKDTYDKFVSGKYSKISNVDKNIILSYWTDVYAGTQRPFINKLRNILNRAPSLREELETKLNVKLKKDAELSSIIDIENEIFYEF